MYINSSLGVHSHLVDNGSVRQSADEEIRGELCRHLCGLGPLHQLAEDEELPLEGIAGLTGLPLNQDLSSKRVVLIICESGGLIRVHAGDGSLPPPKF